MSCGVSSSVVDNEGFLLMTSMYNLYWFMGKVLLFHWGLVLMFDECLLNTVWHDDFTCLFVIILVDGLANDKGAAPVY